MSPFIASNHVRASPTCDLTAIEGMCNVLRLLKTQNPRIGEVNIGLERMGRWTASLYDRTRNHHFANESKMGEEYVGFLRIEMQARKTFEEPSPRLRSFTSLTRASQITLA